MYVHAKSNSSGTCNKHYFLERGEWRATAPSDGKTAGFHLNGLYSPLGWKGWEEIVDDFLKAKADPQRLKTFVMWLYLFLSFVLKVP